MNKQELEERIRLHKIRIAKLQEQLADAEKPELRHGDFGISKADLPWLAVKTMTGELKVEVFWYDSADPSNLSNNDFIDSRLGNIFDLMKDWGKDLTHFELDVNHYSINTMDFPHAPVHIAGNWHTEAEAYKFWCDFGQMIMTLKREARRLAEKREDLL